MSRRKRLGCLGISAFLWLALPSLSWAQQGCASCAASFGTPCAVGCQSFHCPPAYRHCQEGPPHIHWKCGCPHPICNPCDLPHWGYYDTCWIPWPYPPSFAHCPSPPVSTFVQLNPYVNPTLPPVRTMPPGAMPAPSFPGPNGYEEEVIPLPPPRGNRP